MTTSKKKKKSARERRVLVASIICAGLIVASSTFAWFTSTDEVTNRLTATADYGVSIVESFTPPENWVPGQKVNKDVYATNTGNVPAFVEEDVSGKLNVTFEHYVSSFGVSTAGVQYVTVTGDEKTALEAGGYLIWTDSGEATGEKNVKRVGDAGEDGSYWQPTNTGFYIFRRAITNNIQTVDPTAEKYELEGYYYLAEGDPAVTANTPAGFYKIMIAGNEDRTTLNGDYLIGDRADYVIEKDADGKLVIKGDIKSKIKYVTLKTVDVSAINLEYKDPSGPETRPYLEAKYSVGANQLAQQAAGAVTVANDQADVDAATALINLANAQLSAINTVRTAAVNVQTKASTYNTELGKKNTATTGTEADRASKGEAVITAKNSYSPLGNNIANSNLTVDEITASTLSADDKTLLKKYLNALNNAVSDYNVAVGALNTKVSSLGTSYAKSSTEAQADYNDVKTCLQNVETTYAALKNAAAAIDDQTLHSGLTSGANAQYGFTIDTAKGQIEGLKTALDSYAKSAKDDEDQGTELDKAKAAYIKAIGDYNSAVTQATTDYGTAVTAYNAAKANSFDIKDSTATNFGDVTSGYQLDSTIAGITETSDGDAINSTATTAAGYDKTAPVEKDYVVDVTGLTAGSAFLSTTDTTKVKALGDENATAGEETLRAIHAKKSSDLSTSQTTNDTLNAGAGESVTIKIFLDSEVGKLDSNTWKYIPAEGENTVARFYLNNILDGGATSKKLIDEVVLGEDVSGKFKNLVFDLDVKLTSAQVTYEDDNTLSAKATESVFEKATAAIAQDGTVTWTAKATP